MINMYNIDCMEFMKDKPDDYYDLCITDPPYGIGTPSGTIGKSRNKNNYSDYDDSEENIIKNIVPRINEAMRVSKILIMTPGTKNMCHYKNPDGFGVFYQPATCGLNKWGRNDSQPIFYYGRDPLVGKTIQFCSYKLTEKSNIDFHPCAKPLNAWKWLLKRSGLTGGKVLDPFGGSFTTAIACHDMGFDLDICELDKDYFEAAKKRYENYISQLRMF